MRQGAVIITNEYSTGKDNRFREANKRNKRNARKERKTRERSSKATERRISELRTKNSPNEEKCLKTVYTSKNKIDIDNATNAIIGQYMPLYHKLHSKYCKCIPIEDTLQICYYETIRAIIAYNYRSPLKSWLFLRLRHALQRAMELHGVVKLRRQYYKQGARVSYELLEQPIEDNTFFEGIYAKEEEEIIPSIITELQRKYSAIKCAIFSEYYFLDRSGVYLENKYKINPYPILKEIAQDIKDRI